MEDRALNSISDGRSTHSTTVIDAGTEAHVLTSHATACHMPAELAVVPFSWV